MNTIAGKSTKKTARGAKKAATKRVAAKAAKPRKAVAKSSARKPKKATAKELPAHYAVPKAATKSKGPAVAAKPTLLAGGNPQIGKAEGDGAVQAWIGLLPDWQSARECRVDAVVTRQAPNVHKAIKWHGAWYGLPGVDVPKSKRDLT